MRAPLSATGAPGAAAPRPGLIRRLGEAAPGQREGREGGAGPADTGVPKTAPRVAWGLEGAAEQELPGRVSWTVTRG